MLPALLIDEVAALQGRRLEADDLLALVVSDPQRDLLSWMDDPEIRNSWPPNQQQIFDETCRSTFDLEPLPKNRETFAQSMCERQGPWEALWLRYVETASRLPGLLTLMSSIPQKDLASERSSYFVANQDDENALQQALKRLASADDEQVRSSLKKLHQDHQARLQWLWTELDLSPYLTMLIALNEVTEYTRENFAGPDVETMAKAYQDKYWQADAAAIKAMAAANDDAQRKIVADVLAIIYTPWLLSLIHISEPTRRYAISYAVFCLKKKKK